MLIIMNRMPREFLTSDTELSRFMQPDKVDLFSIFDIPVRENLIDFFYVETLKSKTKTST